MSKSKRNPIPNIIGAVLCVLLLPVVAVSLTLAIRSYLHPEKVATVLGYGPLIVETGSMRPAFKEDDVIIIKECDAGALASGDIIAYYTANGTVVSHRIIGHDSDEGGARLYTTKGDANNVQDREPVPAANVAGVVVRIFPDGGETMRLLRQPWVSALIICVPVGLGLGIGVLAKRLARKNGEEAVGKADEAQL